MDSCLYAQKEANGRISDLSHVSFDSLDDLKTIPPQWVPLMSAAETYQKVQIGVNTPVFTIVPKRLMELADTTNLINAVAHVPEDWLIKVEELPVMGLFFVYAFPKHWKTDLFAGLKAEWKFAPATWIRYIWSQMVPNKGVQVFVHLQQRSIQIACMNGRSLLLYNQYKIVSAQDALYFVLLVFEQFKLDPERMPIFISGELTKEGAIYRLFEQYIRYLYWTPIPMELDLHGDLSKPSPQRYLDLWSLATHPEQEL